MSHQSENTLIQADAMADTYDDYTRSNHWRCPEKIHSITREVVQKGQTLLDLGIGTGQGAAPFRKQGLVIYGIDGSQKMLNICRRKGIAFSLCQVDLTKSPIPYPDFFFDNIIASGLLHIVPLYDPLLNEIHRILRPGGHFVFTFDPWIEEKQEGYSHVEEGIYKKLNEDSGIYVYRYGVDRLLGRLRNLGFHTVRGETFTAFKRPDTGEVFRFCAWLTRKSLPDELNLLKKNPK